MRNVSPLLASCCLALVPWLTACGSQGGGATVPGHAVAASPSQALASVAFRIVIPSAQAATAGSRRTQFISPSTQSMTVAVNGGAPTSVNLTPTSPNCQTQAATLTCTAAVNAPVAASVLFAVTMWDGLNGSGNLLSTASMTQAIVSAQANTVNIALGGVIASVALALTPVSFAGGVAGTATLSATAKDQDGNVITGPAPYTVPIVVASNDTSGTTSLSSTTISAPGQTLTVSYTGTAVPASVSFSPTATGVTATTPGLLAFSDPCAVSGIANGNFNLGLQCWTTVTVASGGFSGYPHFTTPTSFGCLPSQTGNPYFMLDVPGNADGYIMQTFTVPAAATTLNARVFGALQSATVTISLVDSLAVEHVLDSFVPAPLQAGGTTCTANAPAVKTYNVASFQGQRMTLRLRGTSAGNNGTIVGFDDVSVQ